ncbi:hypothetical protein COX69_00740 [Candidatus Falkowbacteria bacterium CG_4_10_14_0_2_um_filter_48_10]|uniref:Type II secretion system protein GspF domain-containing protein n=1 Tax=Candidatus Falkowbacteria bacterium CG23_combo_of_CG06-09_8_20_14_all_49_15 TaxID=1974572 RepID=A0A2G9ZM18_9BACT|nr:MAG: hypothetical protein COX22_03380 [Candidatus Falkowbacteria bacterium CG23_combo_of_CG06-09_8_20_14_all_49_15]PJA09088.1 MAG: hypothetical protein COX69_00740 [Candidatus Falkowbacteria bacterium CG_4_10_14_0_2_um_filter_48_10]
MALFTYQAEDHKGRQVTGLVEAGNESAALEILKEKNFQVYSLKKKSLFFNLGNLSIFRRVGRKDIVSFSRRFAVLVASNITIVQALKIIVAQTNNAHFRFELASVAQEVDGGVKLSDALARRPDIFSNFFTSVVRSGESSGSLSEVLNYLADEMEKDYDMMGKIQGAMIYPLFVIALMIGVGILMMTTVVPNLTSVMVETGMELPLSTRIVIGTSDFFQDYWIFLTLFLAAAGVGLSVALKTPGGRSRFDRLLLGLPVFGALVNKIAIVRFARSLNVLLTGGVPIAKALEITAEVVDNAVYRELISATIKEVEDGNPVSSAMNGSIMPPMVSQMIGIGEETGKLDLVLQSIIGFYEREVANTTKNLTVLIEPIVMVVLGLGVGVMVSAIILPMYQMASNF